MSQVILYIAYALIGAAVYLVVRMLLQEEESRAVQENLEDLRNRKASNVLLKLTRPFYTQYFLPMVRSRKYWDSFRKKYKRKIVSAALREEITPDELIAFKLLLIIVFPIIGGMLRALDVYEFPWYVIVGSAALGWFYPDLWMRSRIKKRQKHILKMLPFTVDLLALSTEAGLDFVGSIGKVVDKSAPGPLVDELGQLLKEIRVGSSRADALREMANRIDMTEVNSFISILISADQMGASIGKILRQQSEQIRTERMLRAEKAGAEASQKVILPLVFLIVPAVLLMILGPFAISFLHPGGP